MQHEVRMVLDDGTSTTGNGSFEFPHTSLTTMSEHYLIFTEEQLC